MVMVKFFTTADEALDYHLSFKVNKGPLKEYAEADFFVITPNNLKSSNSIKLAYYFHNELEEICERYQRGSYKKYKNWCDEYFFLPHRSESRGLARVFYDCLDSKNW